MGSLSTIDLIILVFIGIGAFRGYRSGFAKQLLATVGLFLAFIIGAALMGPVGAMVVEPLGFGERIAPIVGFIVVNTAVLGGVAFVGYLFRKALEAVKLKSLDDLAGALIGGIKAAFVLSLLLLASGFAPTPGGAPLIISEETRENSLLVGPVEAVAPELWSIIEAITPGIQDALTDKFNSWQEDESTSPLYNLSGPNLDD